jgi:S-formylglutathione hydrolase FrmB
MPSGATRVNYQTLYLLHGLSDDHTIWLRRTSIERYAAAKNLAIVMPAVARSFYQDMASGPKYWTFVSEELPAMMRQFFPLSALREDNFAAGLSMGGYGALRLGLAKPGNFAAAASLSGALDYVKRLKEAGKEGSRINKAEWVSIAGEELKGEGTDSDLFATAQKVATSTGAPRPKLYVCCGTEDELIEDNRSFHRHLDAMHYEHTYEEGPGNHEWGYWDTQIRKVLDWLPLRP